MNKQKKKVLWVGEASYLNSGYALYAHNLLTRLYERGNLEIAELASYGTMNDPRVKNIPWTYFANNVEPTDPKQLRDMYKSRSSNEHGEWRFDKTCLVVRPDIVCTYRDPWYDAFVENSHLRPYFSTLTMPTADSLYLQPEWLNTYAQADGCLTYTEWSKKVLDEEGGGKINTIGAAPYGMDYDIFSPAKDKKLHKESMGISGDSIIIGTVMRNQKRKLFPDLLQAFANTLDELPENIRNNVYLYLHTSYPDRSCWDLPRLIKECRIGSKVLVSYICKFCKNTSSLIFQDARTRCPICNNIGCVMPNVGLGYSTEQLVNVYRLFDMHVQYAAAGGFEIPMVEAVACGVPVAAVDYSAMQDFADRVGAYKIPVQRFYREFESHMMRAYPDNDKLTSLLTKFCQLPASYREKKGLQMRSKAIPYYNWDRVASVWEEAILNISKPKRNWNDPPMMTNINKDVPNSLSNSELVKHVFTNLYTHPENIYNINGMNLLRDLNFGASVTSNGMENLDKKKVVERLIGKAEGRNLAEQARCGLIKMQEEPFITFAKTRGVKNV